MSGDAPPPGEASMVVSATDTAAAVGSGDLAVLGTPVLCALMERAAVACLAGRLAPGETSVGTEIAIAHLAASAVGAEVQAVATVTERDGRRVRFHIVVRDGGRLVGEAKHTRVIVDAGRFMGRVQGA